eukprot:GGOE01009888.1.p2 GENE.GGOE01009888.1~~GGOE01009888.1.p2  ORF type:complete len:146 (-),score=24.83 GGOE01009888.1:1011-1397(-)
MADAANAIGPSIVVANGKARVGTLVLVVRDSQWQDGKVTTFDTKRKTVVVELDEGGSVTLDSSEVQRQGPASLRSPRIGKEPKPECHKCNGTGERRALLGLSSRMKQCKACAGTGHLWPTHVVGANRG